MDLAATSVSGFLEQTAARSPTPGGGAVAAVTGAMGAALGSMVLAYSADREGSSADLEAVLAVVRKSLEDLRGLLTEQAGRDAAAYAAVEAARALPRAAEEERRQRREAVQGALCGAIEVPLGIATACREGLEAMAALAGHTNPHLVTDLGGAARLLATGAELAALNVRVNARSLKDRELGAAFRGRLDRILGRCRELAAQVGDVVERALEGAVDRAGK